MRGHRWMLVVVLALGLGCEEWACERSRPGQQVGLEDTEWQTYALKHLRQREFDARDWEPLFRVVQKESLNESSLEYAVAELFEVADPSRQERLLALLLQRAQQGESRYAPLAAVYHLQAAMQERSERGGASPEVYADWLERALAAARLGAQAGDMTAMRLFGEIVLYDPSTLAAHRSEAHTWLQRAAELGEPQAKELLKHFGP